MGWFSKEFYCVKVIVLQTATKETTNRFPELNATYYNAAWKKPFSLLNYLIDIHFTFHFRVQSFFQNEDLLQELEDLTQLIIIIANLLIGIHCSFCNSCFKNRMFQRGFWFAFLRVPSHFHLRRSNKVLTFMFYGIWMGQFFLLRKSVLEIHLNKEHGAVERFDWPVFQPLPSPLSSHLVVNENWPYCNFSVINGKNFAIKLIINRSSGLKFVRMKLLLLEIKAIIMTMKNIMPQLSLISFPFYANLSFLNQLSKDHLLPLLAFTILVSISI